jgi:hypothetical protein
MIRAGFAPRRVCLLGALALLLFPAATALGAPAGDEYLPKVPKGAGEEVTAQGESEEGSSVLAPAVRGGDGPPGGPGSEGGEGGSPVGQTASSEEDSGGALDTLLDPIVLLLIAGVAAAAVGMTMRRREAIAGEPETAGATREAGSTPPTPDGEIVGREPNP